MLLYKNLIFGASGVIGSEFINRLNIKDSLFTSRKKPISKKQIIWQKIDLNKNNLNKLPNKVKTIFFFASPHYTEKNLNIKNCFKKELFWVKKIIKNINCEKFVFTSSSSVYSNNHQIGIYKKKIEKELRLSKIKFIQIWRPFSLIGFNNYTLSDHFHNVLIKDVIKKNKTKIDFHSSINDERGYSSVSKFCNEVYKKHKMNKSFIYNYRNKNLIKLEKIIEIFKLVLKKNNLNSFDCKFKNLKTNKNFDYKKLENIKTIFSNEKSERILNNHFNNVIRNEKKCNVCKKNINLVLNLGNHPCADTFLSNKKNAIKIKKYPLKVGYCNCHHLSSIHDISEHERYKKFDYSYTAGNSPVSTNHFKIIAKKICKNFIKPKKNKILEIASNDGTFLEQVKKLKSISEVGIDPSNYMCELADKKGINTEALFFSLKTSHFIKKKYGLFNLIYGANVFNHIDDPYDFIRGCKKILKPNGILILEFPDLDQLLEKISFDTIYHEHRNYYSKSSLLRIFKKMNLNIIKFEKLEYMSGSLRIYVKNSKFKPIALKTKKESENLKRFKILN